MTNWRNVLYKASLVYFIVFALVFTLSFSGIPHHDIFHNPPVWIHIYDSITRKLPYLFPIALIFLIIGGNGSTVDNQVPSQNMTSYRLRKWLKVIAVISCIAILAPIILVLITGGGDGIFFFLPVYAIAPPVFAASIVSLIIIEIFAYFRK